MSPNTFIAANTILSRISDLAPTATVADLKTLSEAFIGVAHRSCSIQMESQEEEETQEEPVVETPAPKTRAPRGSKTPPAAASVATPEPAEAPTPTPVATPVAAPTPAVEALDPALADEPTYAEKVARAKQVYLQKCNIKGKESDEVLRTFKADVVALYTAAGGTSIGSVPEAAFDKFFADLVNK